MATVWLAAGTILYLDGGGHFWVFLNWALGLKAAGCNVVWVESAPDGRLLERATRNAPALRARLKAFGFQDLVVCSEDGERGIDQRSSDLLRRSYQADLLLDLSYAQCAPFLDRFRRSAIVDIDPGLLQQWLARGSMTVLPYDVFFTTGETVARGAANVPDVGVQWEYTPPCVTLEAWPLVRAPADAKYTTVSHWEGREWVEHSGESYDNTKRAGFLPFLTLPHRSPAPLELALSLGDADDPEIKRLESYGWSVRDSYGVCATPEGYRTYIQASRGEFSCAKPSCVRLQNAWISDRTLCYLASGKPAVVQHTGPSEVLPDRLGLLRFSTLEEAIELLAEAETNYARHASAARELAEQQFDARRVAAHVVERALGTRTGGASAMSPSSQRPEPPQ